MNFFDAHLVKDGDGYYVNCSGSKVELPEKIQEKLKASNAATQDIVLGIRPEHISFVPASQSEGTLVGTVDVSEMMAASCTCTFPWSRITVRSRTWLCACPPVTCPMNFAVVFPTVLSFTLPSPAH